ncbi:PIN domain-containing protein [Cryobacterium sp. Hh7]|uniref:PIN domain-containing protein n=1 Tax=Cryobacterium sp. Hh7 TaxID=1259159 RepID=UPI00106B1F4E|nr:PIN domain-containing protein [Cryobacterium sp. Hh7]TFD51115.1 PIN domain-containing protein [Cryobacterium sp. Hh7]
MAFRAFLDANVLVPARLRDVLLTLAEVGLYEPLWSLIALEETARHLPTAMSPEDRRHLFRLMNGAFPGALVAWPGAVDLDVRLQINEKDRHIVAAALWGNSDLILTDDGTFREELLKSGLVDAQSTPEFLAYAMDTDTKVARRALFAMARNRWGVTGTDVEIRGRLTDYFERKG